MLLDHGERVLLGGLWIGGLALATAGVVGGWSESLVLFLALAPPAVWLALGMGEVSRWRTLVLVYPLWRALRNGELVLFFQPKADAMDGRVRSVEALVRWRHPRKGLLLPGAFLSAINDGVWLRRFNRFVISEAVRHACAWSAAGRPLRISVNVSPRYLVDPDFVPFLQALCESTDVDCDLLRVEVPETPISESDDKAFGDAVRAVKQLGISVSIDDFGVGHSSLARLVELPIDVVKIDRRFTAGLAHDVKADRVVHTAIDLAHSLGLVVVAEGVETEEQWVQLSAWGCDLVQGFKLQRPVPADELWAWLDATGRDITELGARIASRQRHRFGQPVGVRRESFGSA